MPSWMSLITKAAADPVYGMCVVMAIVRGALVKQWYRLVKPNVRFGKDLRAFTWPVIKGPGRVVIGDNVRLERSLLRNPVILTHVSSARVRIGNGCCLSGTRISCVESVTVGDFGLIGTSTIMDSQVVPYCGMRIDHEWVRDHVRPVTIGSHFWGGLNSFVLPGTQIGDECVLGAGSVIGDITVEDRSLIIGNPARRAGQTRRE